VKKITILSHNLSDNSFGRAYLLARVLKRRYNVEIVGTCFGEGIWTPCSDLRDIEHRFVRGYKYPRYLISLNRMMKMITGDVVYAVKARPTSFGAGIIKHLSSRLPLVLDIDDWEVGFYLRTRGLRFIEKCLNLWSPNSLPYCWLMEKMTGLADQITTVSPFLQDRFGGIIIPHGKDTDFFNPAKFNPVEAKRKIVENGDKVKIIMFLGTPRRHKGLEDVIKALELLGRNDIVFAIVGGNLTGKYERHIMKTGGDRVRLLGMISFNDVPLYLSAADIVVIPQRATPDTIGQVPAKVFDAMSMAKPIISTKVSMLPDILNGCCCLVDAGNINQLSTAIEYLLSNPDEARQMGLRARSRCIEKYSWDKMEEDLVRIFDRY